MANFLLDALQGVGNVLDTPGSVVRGLLSGDASAALGGITDTSKRVSGRDLLNRWGVTDDDSGVAGDIGGFAAGLATDPLMWLGGGALGKLLSRGGKAEEAASVASKVAPEATTLLEAAPGVGGYEKLADGTIRRTAAMPEAATQKIGALGEKLGGGPGFANDAQAWTGNKFSDRSLAMDNRLVPGVETGEVAPLLNLRRDFSVAKNIGLDDKGMLNFDAVGGLNAPGGTASRAKELFESVKRKASASMDEASPLNGSYDPRSKLATILDRNNSTLRHETMHGLIDAARRSGDSSGLSLLPRSSLKMQNSSNQFLRGLGEIGEEASAYSAEGRGFEHQLVNILKFLDNPTAGYAADYAKISPLAAKLYSSALIPNSLRVGAAGTAGVGTYMGANALLGGN